MPALKYPYLKYPGHNRLPLASCFALNTLNGKYTEFIGILDTGADTTALTEDVLEDLEIDLSRLPEVVAGGVDGEFRTVACDFLRIAFLERETLAKHWPNGLGPVPVSLINGPFSLLGRELFLDLCTVTFDGPNQMASIQF